MFFSCLVVFLFSVHGLFTVVYAAAYGSCIDGRLHGPYIAYMAVYVADRQRDRQDYYDKYSALCNIWPRASCGKSDNPFISRTG